MTPEERILQKNKELGNIQETYWYKVSTYGFHDLGHFNHAKKIYWKLAEGKSPIGFVPKIKDKDTRILFYQFAAYLHDTI